MSRKRKADYTPEEWAERLRKQREKRAVRRANGITFPSETKECKRAESQRFRDRHKGTDRYRYKKSLANKAYASSPKGQASRKKGREQNRDRYREYRKRYEQRRAEGATPGVTERMSPQHVFDTITKALANRYDFDTRMDMVQEAALAFLEGDVASIKDAVTLGMKRHWKRFSKFTTRSLDAEIADGLRMIDLIDSEHERA